MVIFLRIISIICVVVSILLDAQSRYLEASIYMVSWLLALGISILIDKLDKLIANDSFELNADQKRVVDMIHKYNDAPKVGTWDSVRILHKDISILSRLLTKLGAD